MLLSHKDSPSPSAVALFASLVNPALLKRHTRTRTFGQYVLGYRTLAIANTVQFSVCSGVLRVLGLLWLEPQSQRRSFGCSQRRRRRGQTFGPE
jgi:hypothetical protein